MEKLSLKFEICLLIALTIFLYLWDISIFNIQLKFSILILLLFIIKDINKFILTIKDYKILIFLLIFIHLYLNSNFLFFSYQFYSFIFFFMISLIIILYKSSFLLIIGKSIYIFQIFLVTVLIFSFIILSDLKFSYFIDFFNNTNYIFKENSHFGMISASIMIYSLNEFLVSKKFLNISTFFFILILSYLNFSLTGFYGLLFSSLFLLLTNFLS